MKNDLFCSNHSAAKFNKSDIGSIFSDLLNPPLASFRQFEKKKKKFTMQPALHVCNLFLPNLNTAGVKNLG